MVGYTLRSALVQSGEIVSLKGWVKPVAEAEIAVHIGRDLDGEADDATVRAAIAALGPAIELIDVPSPADRRNARRGRSPPACSSGMWCSARRIRRAPAAMSRD